MAIDATANRITGSPYAYDLNGNMTNDGLNTLVYDAENRLVTSSGSTYSYDGNSLRVKKVSGGTTTVYLFSGTKVIAEYVNGAAPNSPTKEYVYSGSKLLAIIAGGTTTYHHADHLSVRLTTDTTGNALGQQGHYPYGESWYSVNTTTKWQFTSYERDSESGNDYAMMRYQVNRLGRFTSPDRLGGSLSNPQSLNRYGYVADDPINLADPLGLLPIDDCWESNTCGAAGAGPPPGPLEIKVNPLCLDASCTSDGMIDWDREEACRNNLLACGGWIPGLLECGVDPFCMANPPGPFDSPVAQTHCDDQGCMGGSYLYSQYIAGVGYVVDWAAEREALNDQAVNAFLDQLQLVAAVLSALAGTTVTPEDVLAASIGANPNNPLFFLKGGNWNFRVPSNVSAPPCPHDRCGDFPSAHFDRGYTSVHVDTANPFRWFGLGGLVHLGVDVILGNTIYASGIPR